MKSKILKLLIDNGINYNDQHKDYIEIPEKNVRIYSIDDAYKYRYPYIQDEIGGIKDKKFFQTTSIDNEKNGIRTIWIKPWEFTDDSRQKNVISSIILAACGKIKNVFNGRDCEVREITTKELRQFLEKNSFYGFRGAALSLGLFLKKDISEEHPKGTLLMVYTFGFPYFGAKKKKYDLEIIRAATLINCQIRGGASKLFKNFTNNYNSVQVGGKEVIWNKICYYVDYDHNNGNSLTHLGFDFEGYAGAGFMNVYKETGIHFHRKPLLHKQIMEQIRNGEVFSVFNAGVKVFTYTKNVEVKDDSDFINE